MKNKDIQNKGIYFTELPKIGRTFVERSQSGVYNIAGNDWATYSLSSSTNAGDDRQNHENNLFCAFHKKLISIIMGAVLFTGCVIGGSIVVSKKSGTGMSLKIVIFYSYLTLHGCV